MGIGNDRSKFPRERAPVCRLGGQGRFRSPHHSGLLKLEQVSPYV